MPHFSSKAAIIILIAGFVSIAAFAQNWTGKKEEHKAHNLTVLPKDIPHDSLIYLMKMYSVSLGVHCNYCHAKASDGSDHLDFASDNNDHKKIARYMITMTSGINDTYFKEANFKAHSDALMVSCFTCHNGHHEPERFKMPKEEEHH